MIPRVSVVVPTRNRRRLLARALASVEAQGYRSFEVIVVDDASTDGSSEWLRRALPSVSLIETRAHRGAGAARNRGVERARGEIVAFLDDDDGWLPRYLETQVAQFDANPGAWLCSTGHVEVDGHGRRSHPDQRPLLNYQDPLIHLLAECPLHTLSLVACRRSAFARFGPFDEALSIVHDLDWYARLMSGGGQQATCSEMLVERSVPGGLVTRYRQWHAEELSVHRRLFATRLVTPRNQRRVRAARAMFFARIGFGKGDLRFALSRLAEAALASPLDSVRVAVRRVLGGRRRGATQAWDGRPVEAR